MSSNALLQKQLQHMLPCCWASKRLVLQQEPRAWYCLQDFDPGFNHLNINHCMPCDGGCHARKQLQHKNQQRAVLSMHADGWTVWFCSLPCLTTMPTRIGRGPRLGSYLGHVVEGAKGDKAIQQCRQWGHLWSICTPAQASVTQPLVAGLTPTKLVMTFGPG